MAGVSPWDLGLCWTLHGLRQADDRSGLRVSSNFHIQGLSAVRQWGASLKKLGGASFPGFAPRSSSCSRKSYTSCELPGLSPSTTQVGREVS